MTMTLSKGQNKAQASEEGVIDFEALFQAHWTRLCRLLYSIVGDMDEAQDLVLEAFVQLYQRPPRDTGNLSGWLYRVASNRGLNALRARQRRQHYEGQAGIEALESERMDDPAAALERQEERLRVHRTLAKIKPRSAQILMLRHSGLSYAEIAVSVGVASTSVGKLLTRAEDEFERRFNQE